MQELKTLPPDEKRTYGAQVNVAKQTLLESIQNKRTHIESVLIEQQLLDESIDITLPGRTQHLGSKHPITRVIEEVTDYFSVSFVTIYAGSKNLVLDRLRMGNRVYFKNKQ